MWPYICRFVEKVLRETVEPAIKESNSHLSTFGFSKIDIGEKVSAALLPLRDGVSLQPAVLGENKQTNKKTPALAAGGTAGGVGRERVGESPQTDALVA